MQGSNAWLQPLQFMQSTTEWFQQLQSVKPGWGFFRRITVQIQSLSDQESKEKFSFGGEWFESGGWKNDSRIMELEEHTSLEFESKVWLQGVSGYVFYRNADHSQTIFIAFSCPVTTAPAFTARAVSTLPDCQALWERMPELARPGAGLRRSEGCAWETSELADEHVVVRCVVFPSADTHCLPEEFGHRLRKAKYCKSMMKELQHPPELLFPCPAPARASCFPEKVRQGEALLSGAGAPGSNASRSTLGDLVARRFIVEIDNRSEENFMIDGDWFEAGRWTAKPVSGLPPKSKSVLEFSCDEVLRGLSGVAWYVNETSLNTYFSMAFSNPLAGQGTFSAWAGPPPSDLRTELLDGDFGLNAQTGVQAPDSRGCAWNVIERGVVVRIRLIILPELAPLDLTEWNLTQCSRPASSVPQCEQRPKAPSDAPVAKTTAVASFEGQENRNRTEAEVNEVDMIEEEDVSGIGEIVGGNIVNFVAPRPRDALDGVYCGLKVAGGCILAGSAAFVAAPYYGSEDGLSGFAFGLAKGTAAAAVGAVGGLALGVTQVGRGLYHTPEAIREANAGRRWDDEAKVWVDDFTNLRAEVAMAKEQPDDSEDDEDQCDENEGPRQVADTTYYDIVGVAPDATASQMRKMYFKTALQVHPDKNPNDPEASHKFQQLTQAYQVLSDPRLRKRYDQVGKEGMPESEYQTIDPTLFFMTLFGSERFERYIGKLNLASFTDPFAKICQKEFERRQAADFGMPSTDEAQAQIFGEAVEKEVLKQYRRMKKMQFAREVRCASHLVERLNRWVMGRDEVGFVQSISVEASELVNVSFGDRLLRTVGSIYESSAEQYFAHLRGNFTVETQVAQWKESTKQTKARMNIVSSLYQSGLAVKRVHAAGSVLEENIDGEEGEGSQGYTNGAKEKQEEAQRECITRIEESLPVFLQAVWDVNAVDIESTVRHVCGKVLKDISVPWQIRHRRAFALLRLGRVFRDTGSLETNDFSQTEVAKRQLEEALHEANNDKSRASDAKDRAF